MNGKCEICPRKLNGGDTCYMISIYTFAPMKYTKQVYACSQNCLNAVVSNHMTMGHMMTLMPYRLLTDEELANYRPVDHIEKSEALVMVGG